MEDQIVNTDRIRNLGKQAKDKVTGFEGIITAYAIHLYGCNSYFITPKAVNGERKDSGWFDEGRIEIIGEGIQAKEVQTDRPGGEELADFSGRE